MRRLSHLGPWLLGLLAVALAVVSLVRTSGTADADLQVVATTSPAVGDGLADLEAAVADLHDRVVALDGGDLQADRTLSELSDRVSALEVAVPTDYGGTIQQIQRDIERIRGCIRNLRAGGDSFTDLYCR